jgi:hypothetical protein
MILLRVRAYIVRSGKADRGKLLPSLNRPSESVVPRRPRSRSRSTDTHTRAHALTHTPTKHVYSYTSVVRRGRRRGRPPNKCICTSGACVRGIVDVRARAAFLRASVSFARGAVRWSARCARALDDVLPRRRARAPPAIPRRAPPSRRSPRLRPIGRRPTVAAERHPVPTRRRDDGFSAAVAVTVFFSSAVFFPHQSRRRRHTHTRSVVLPPPPAHQQMFGPPALRTAPAPRPTSPRHVADLGAHSSDGVSVIDELCLNAAAARSRGSHLKRIESARFTILIDIYYYVFYHKFIMT